MCLFIGIGLANAQSKKVTGTIVSNEDGQPIIGASVLVKGTTVGATSDLDGKFVLNNVPASAKTLTVSFLGMKQVEVVIKPVLKIVLVADAKVVDEVVVTAMGISREKKALGYAVQDVKADKLTQASNSNLATALQGKVSGVDIKPSSGMPGASAQITIRGARSFSGNNTPLYVIDGMPVSSTSDVGTGNSVSGTDFANRAVDVDPNDIESVNILKGQAASALYGIRASNGVIVITTKSGKGMAKGKPQVTFSSNVSFDVIGRYPEVQTTYAQGVNGKYSEYSSNSWGPKITDLPNDPVYGGNVANQYTGTDLTTHKGQYYVPQRAAAGLDPWATPQAYNNIKDFFNTGVTWNNSLNIAQAFEKTSYSLSLGSSKQDGIIPATGMSRYNFKLSAETKLTNSITSGFAVNYVTTNIDKMPSANDGTMATVYPAPPSYDLAGIPSHVKGNPYLQNGYRGGFTNAYWMTDNNTYNEKTNRFYGNMYLNYMTNFGTSNHKLNVKYQAGVDAYTTHYQDVWSAGSYGKGTDDGGQIENYGWTNATYNSLLTANYDWTISDNLTFNAVLGNELVQDNRKYYYQYGATFNFSGWNHISNATTKDLGEEQWKKRTVGFFGSASISYKNMLYLNLTGRNDYVSSMPRGSRSFFYPSASLGFILTELDALKGNHTVNFAKIRASYAQVGQAGDYQQNYYYTPSYGSGFYGSSSPIVYPLNGVNGYAPYYVVFDPKLKPQNTKSYELGLDLNFFDSFFGISYTYSRQNVNDQIFNVPLAGSTGASSMLTNGGRMHTNSHEVTLTFNPIKSRNIDWSLGVNWTKTDNYVDELAPGVESIMLGGFVTPQVRAGIGEKFPVIYGSSYKRDAQDRLLVDANGLPMVGEAKVIGRVSPDFIMGFNNTVRLWKFTVNAVFDWKSGGQMYSGTNNLLDFYGVSKKTESRDGTLIFDGYKADGTKNDIKITGANAQQKYYSVVNGINESAVYNNSFVKMRELAVNYLVVKKKSIELSANLFVRNILIWTNYPNFDPESSQGNTNMTGAFERFSLPQTSSYGLGFNVKF